MSNPRSISGIIPAAGFARRISPLPCSKEIYPIRQTDGRSHAVASYLLKRLARAGAGKSFFIIRHGKWDIPEYFGGGAEAGQDLAYIVTEATRGVPFTVDKAYPFVKDDLVLLGFPDIILKPADAFGKLLEKQETTGADLVVGLFKTAEPEKTDVVMFNEDGRIKDIIIKPAQTELTHTWINAVWTPVFTQFLHQYAAEPTAARKSCDGQLGEVFREALQEGLNVCYVLFEEGRFLDIGTPDNLKKASHINWLE